MIGCKTSRVESLQFGRGGGSWVRASSVLKKCCKNVSNDKEYDLICFDVDGTLVRHPSNMVIWEVLNLKFGGSREINRLRYQMYCEGKLSYERWVQLDVQTWIDAGATRDEIVASINEFSLFRGARESVHELKKRGYKLAVISGTLDILLETLFRDHPFDTVFTNRIFFDDDGKLRGVASHPF